MVFNTNKEKGNSGLGIAAIQKKVSIIFENVPKNSKH